MHGKLGEIDARKWPLVPRLIERLYLKGNILRPKSFLYESMGQFLLKLLAITTYKQLANNQISAQKATEKGII
jgi:hypothetical protein